MGLSDDDARASFEDQSASSRDPPAVLFGGGRNRNVEPNRSPVERMRSAEQMGSAAQSSVSRSLAIESGTTPSSHTRQEEEHSSSRAVVPFEASSSIIPFELPSSPSAEAPNVATFGVPSSSVQSIVPFGSIQSSSTVSSVGKLDGTKKRRVNPSSRKRKNAEELVVQSSVANLEESDNNGDTTNWLRVVQQLQNPTSEDERRQLLSEISIDEANMEEDSDDDDVSL